jgi:hypothetical protein
MSVDVRLPHRAGPRCHDALGRHGHIDGIEHLDLVARAEWAGALCNQA